MRTLKDFAHFQTADSGWQLDKLTSSPARGIHDYSRVLVFKREMHDYELKTLCELLSTDKPGVSPLECVQTKIFNDRFAVRFFCTTDSSD